MYHWLPPISPAWNYLHVGIHSPVSLSPHRHITYINIYTYRYLHIYIYIYVYVHVYLCIWEVTCPFTGSLAAEFPNWPHPTHERVLWVHRLCSSKLRPEGNKTYLNLNVVWGIPEFLYIQSTKEQTRGVFRFNQELASLDLSFKIGLINCNGSESFYMGLSDAICCFHTHPLYFYFIQFYERHLDISALCCALRQSHSQDEHAADVKLGGDTRHSWAARKDMRERLFNKHMLGI